MEYLVHPTDVGAGVNLHDDRVLGFPKERRHPRQHVRLGPLDVDLDEVDIVRRDPFLSEERVEGRLLDSEIPPIGEAALSTLLPELEPDATIGSTDGAFVRSNAGEPVQLDVLVQVREVVGVRFERVYLPALADDARRFEGVVPFVTPDST